MQVLDSLIDGPLQLGSTREADELLGMIVRYLRTGEEPKPRTAAQRAVVSTAWPVMRKSRAKSESGSKGGSRTASERRSEARTERESEQIGNGASERPTEEEEE